MTKSPEAIVSLAAEIRIDSCCDKFELQWQLGNPVQIESLLNAAESSEERRLLLRRLIEVELELLTRAGHSTDAAEYAQRFPNDSEMICSVFGPLGSGGSLNETCLVTELQGTWPTDGSVTRHPTATTSGRQDHSIGRFKIISILGRGGFGVVYKVHDPGLNREVAVKVPNERALLTPDQLQRFRREARAAAAVSHPSICPVYESGDVDGCPFIVMACISGETLAAKLRRGERLTAERSVELVARVAEALVVAHRKGVVHRDIKPSNIMITESGDPVITDFGLAHTEESGDTSLTAEGDLLGSPAYMSPEQAKAAPANVGMPTDIYSLGVVLFELLSGRRPFTGNAREVITQLVGATAPLGLSTVAPEVDGTLSEICLKAMAIDPANRFASMEQFSNALANWLQPQPEKTTRSTLVFRPQILIAAVCLLLITAATLYVQTDQGWLIIESGDEAVNITIRKDGRVISIVDTQTKSQVRLKSGAYEIELEGTANDVKLSTSAFVMTRGHREIVSISKIDAEQLSKNAKGLITGRELGHPGPPDVRKPQPPGAAAHLTAEPPQGGWFDLLSHVDVTRHVIAGDWSRHGSILKTQASTGSRIVVPYRPKGEYELELSFTRTQGVEAIIVMLPVKERRAALILGGWANSVSVLLLGRGDEEPFNSTRVERGLVNGQRHHLTVRVFEAVEIVIIEVTLDGKQIISWKGNASELAMVPDHETWKSDSLAMIAENIIAEIFDCRVRLLSPESQLVRIDDPVTDWSGTPGPGKLPMPSDVSISLQQRWAAFSKVPLEQADSVGLRFRLIPPGEFNMSPEYHVTISRPYYVSDTEVTVSEFRDFVEATGYKTEAESSGRGGSLFLPNAQPESNPALNWKNPGYSAQESDPVTQICWLDALAFCAWLSEKEQQIYRLPTEAEWEWACRAGSNTRFCFGDDEKQLSQYAWFAENSDLKPNVTRMKRPNTWGLYDMHGNVQEFTSEWVSRYPLGRFIDPRGPEAGETRIARGGYFFHPANLCTSDSNRPGYWESASPVWTTNIFGFRVVKEISLSPNLVESQK